MALKPTIYKVQLHISNFDDDVYASPQLTLAQHPSETLERLTARIVAYCFNYQEQLKFSAGLSSPDEPDIYCDSLDGRRLLWIDMGEPSVERIKKSSRQSEQLKVYSYNTKSDVWWRDNRKAFTVMDAEYYQLDWQEISALSSCLQRSIDWSMSISSGSMSVAAADSHFEIHLQGLS